ncbi:MAG: hypothetical protein ACRDD1_15565 [Planctomycetia bacterium]
MTGGYNPIVRSYNRYRAALGEILGASRRDLRPGARLDNLVPPERRKEVWKELRARGLDMPDLYDATPPAGCPLHSSMLLCIASAAVWLLTGFLWIAMVFAAFAVLIMDSISKRWVEELEIPPYCRTVGELTVYGVHYKDHPDARWSHATLSLKVRMIVAEVYWLKLDEIRPETRLVDL